MSTFDKPPAKNEVPKRAVRPRDAATLILVNREARGGPTVLMGQRSKGHVFMPDKFVFPGGRLDRGDFAPNPATRLSDHVVQRLTQDPRGARAITAAKAQALAMAALRETFEETGLVLGTADATMPPTRSKTWRPYRDTGIAPRLDTLEFVARAITPPYRNRRFDARFFMADADLIAADKHDEFAGSGELLELHWVPLK
ncbi:MAG: NUDIX hydrolase, partial [Alphaproteobacteria bacterium]